MLQVLKDTSYRLMARLTDAVAFTEIRDLSIDTHLTISLVTGHEDSTLVIPNNSFFVKRLFN
jgi:hypothetical protein